MATPDASTLPTYVYAAASAVASIRRGSYKPSYDLWTWTRQERTRVILASLDALPPLPANVSLPFGVDWPMMLRDEEARELAYADCFNAAFDVAVIIIEERRAMAAKRAGRYGV